MAYDLDEKLVVAIASSALFDLSESDAVFREKGTEAYRQHQRENQENALEPGVAFPFIRRLLSLNTDKDAPVEVILLSKNDPDTGARVFHSIQSHSLDISRAAFLRGVRPYRYIPAFGASLFLSASEEDVMEAVAQGWPAGLVLNCNYVDDPSDTELRVAFDFDGVLADDESERRYRELPSLQAYHAEERAKADQPLSPGPLKGLLESIARIQERERRKERKDPTYSPRVRVAILTARNAPAHQRVVTTLRNWGIVVDEAFFLGGVEKKRILEIFRPHIFFDDQRVHLDPTASYVPSVHVPFGVANQPKTA